MNWFRYFLLSLFAAATAHASSIDGFGHYTLEHGGVTRSYDLYVPPAVMAKHARVPLVIMLHGGGGNAQNAEAMSGFTEKARNEGFIVVYPNGSGARENKLLTWNAGHCCGYAMKHRVDDVGFISALIDTLVRDSGVDPKRVYVTGMSNGALLTHRLGRELTGKIAAIAPDVGGLHGDEPLPPSPLPAMFINGGLDKNVPPAGGEPGGFLSSYSWDGVPLKPAAYQGEYWAAANRCDPTPQETTQGHVTTWRYHCPAGQDVVRYLVLDSGHAWPGGNAGSRMGDTPSTAMNATDVMWDFFRRFSK